MSRRKIYLGLAAVLMVALTTPACKALKKPYPDQQFYLLEASHQGPPLLAGKSLVLEMKPVEVASAYSGREFVYRQADGTMTRDFYHGFFDLPETLLTETLRLWFSGEGMDPVVVRTHGPGEVTHILQGRVLLLMGDYSLTPARAELKIEFLMAQQQGRQSVPFFRKVYHREPALTDSAPAALAEAWNASLAEILTELETDLAKLNLVAWTPPGENTQ
jgi:uncharacterized lipoprotein YmbA